MLHSCTQREVIFIVENWCGNFLHNHHLMTKFVIYSICSDVIGALCFDCDGIPLISICKSCSSGNFNGRSIVILSKLLVGPKIPLIRYSNTFFSLDESISGSNEKFYCEKPANLGSKPVNNETYFPWLVSIVFWTFVGREYQHLLIDIFL